MAISESRPLIELGPADITSGLALSSEAGWNQTADDWLHFMQYGDVIGARDNAGRLVASAAALPYDGAFGFVAMVLVTRSWRRRGLATRLVNRCIDTLSAGDLIPVLDATGDGEKGYTKQGFVRQFRFDRWERALPEHNAPAPTGRPSCSADEVVRLDEQAFGATRADLMRDFLRRDGSTAIRSPSGDGFALMRRGRRALQIGPVVARSQEDAAGLLCRLFDVAAGPVFVDIPSVWRQVGAVMRRHGFSVQRSFSRMALGRAEPFGDQSRLFAVAGPEFG